MLCLRSQFFTMNRIFRIIVCPESFLKTKFRSFGRTRSATHTQDVKVFIDQFDDKMKIAFKYGTMTFSKEEEHEKVLSRIKQIIYAHRKKEELRRAVMSRYSEEAAVTESEIDGEDELGEDVEISLIHNNQLLENGVPNIKAWIQASHLKIGNSLYEVNPVGPRVVTLTLPETILARCAIRPHALFENTNEHESSFVWYHSISEEEVQSIKTSESAGVEKTNGEWWLKVHEGRIYWTSESDIGRKLKVVCTPILGEESGRGFTTVSKNVVQSGPESFPFEERHLYTKELTSADNIRCVSYNILANIYVETKRFPYCSRIAKDIYYRKQLLSRELLGYNSDVLCLQEVQERIFEFDIMPILREVGYDGYYLKKGGRRHEGLACFFRESKFKLISNESSLLNEMIKRKEIFHDLLIKVGGNLRDMSKLLSQDSALQVIVLEDVENPKRKLVVANTHLYSNKDMPEVRLLQSAVCVCYIEHVVKQQDAADQTAVLFCGDFNSLPDSAVVEFLLQGSFSCCPSWNMNGSGSPADTTLRHSLPLASGCGFPTYTNYTEEFSGCLDYIFYDTDLFSVSEVVPLPSHESVTQSIGLPSELFPSDHLPIICTLKWK